MLRIETELAKAEMDRTARRDPKNRDHKMTREEAVALGPNFYLDRYFQDVNAPAFKDLNVTNPDFFKQINGVLESESLDSLKTYVRWQVLNASAPWLSQPYVDANFKFQQALTGQKEIQARWKRCTNLVDRELGEALGQRYVEAVFPPESKARMLKMVGELEKSLGEDIQSLSWMSDETKKQAAIKLAAIHNKIGYPDVWRDYSSVQIKPDDLLGNLQRANEFESKRRDQQDRQTAGSQRVGHDSTDGERILQFVVQRDCVPGGNSAAPVFRSEDGRRGELWRHRAGDWSRTDTRVR